MQPMTRRLIPSLATAVLALAAVALSLWKLHAAQDGVAARAVDIGHIPATVYTPEAGPAGPAIVIAHGFAGSRQLMQSFAIALARNGYTAVTFDFAGHGRNPAPLTGDSTHEDGATRTLVAETVQGVGGGRNHGDGRIGRGGHALASEKV